MLFEKYKDTIENFEKFNVFVLNMPRHKFENMDISFAKELAIILTEIVIIKKENITYVDLYYYIHQFLLNNIPASTPDYVLKLFDFDLVDEDAITSYYNKEVGRKFRHLTQIMKMWNMLNEDNTVNSDVCEEFFALDIKDLSAMRSKIISMDIIDNNFFVELKNIKSKIKEGTNFSYKPAIYILKYMKEINRAVSKFELSNLLGIVLPDCTSAEDLYDNAITIGKQLPENLSQHQAWFFKYMNWFHDDGSLFQYSASQAPEFKFKAFLIFMENLDLIEVENESSYKLTTYAEELLSEKDIPAEIIELEKYIEYAETAKTDKDLADLIIANIKPSLLGYVAKNEAFIKAMNHRSITKPKKDRHGNKIRNRLISELAKVRANYTCQIDPNMRRFKDFKGNHYVEAHHILEFNGEDGPDIVDNLLVINPFYHSLIHHASEKEVFDLYDHLRKNNIVTVDMFKKMHDEYKCFERTHMIKLLQKHLITKIEFDDLVDYIQ